VGFQEAILNRVIGASTAGAKLGLRVLARRILSPPPLLGLSAILFGGCRHARGYKAVLDTQVEVPLDLRESSSQELDEILHGDAAGTVGAIRTRLCHSLLQEFLQPNVAIFQAVIVGGRCQAFDHVPDEGVDLVGS